jgi:hypothetical protein
VAEKEIREALRPQMPRPHQFVTTYLMIGTSNQEERKNIGCNHISRFVGFPSPRPNGLRIRVLHLSRN